MLKKPYVFLNNIGINNYYAIKVDNVYYLATETVLKEKRLFKTKEFTQGLKLLPMRSFFWYLFLEALNLNQIGQKEKEGGLEPEPIFESLAVDKLRERLRNEQKDLNKAMKEKNFITPFDYAKSPHSEAIKMFMEENGSSLLCLETRGAYLRTYHLAKSTQSGDLIIHSCLAQGKPSNEKIVLVETYVFEKSTIKEFLKLIKKVEGKGEIKE